MDKREKLAAEIRSHINRPTNHKTVTIETKKDELEVLPEVLSDPPVLPDYDEPIFLVIEKEDVGIYGEFHYERQGNLHMLQDLNKAISEAPDNSFFGSIKQIYEAKAEGKRSMNRLRDAKAKLVRTVANERKVVLWGSIGCFAALLIFFFVLAVLGLWQAILSVAGPLGLVLAVFINSYGRNPEAFKDLVDIFKVNRY